MSEARKLQVLRAIIEDFVNTSEPVGSKALVERHNLGVSPATIRNDMAALEEEGLIVAPHTSAGRVPTDDGYRLFVDRLANLRPLSVPERRAIQTFLDGAVDLDDVVSRTVRVLSQITQQVAVVQYPRLSRSAVRHVELVRVAPGKVLLVVIGDSGRVEQRLVSVSEEATDDSLADLRARLGAVLDGVAFTEVPARIERLAPSDPGDGVTWSAVLRAVCEAVREDPENRVVMAGAANLARYGGDFHTSLHPILETLEEQVVLLRLLSEQATGEDVIVRIGSENTVETMTETSIVTAGYGVADHEAGRLGLVGPTRMDYEANMAAVRAVARYLGRILADQ